MSGPLPVDLTVDDPDGIGPAVLASLPQSYVATTRGDSTVSVVAGSPGWPDEADEALAAGAAAVVVVRPLPADVDGLRRRRALVVLDTPWAANPVVPAATDAFRAAVPGGTRLECRTCLPTGSAGKPALLDQLTLLRALVGPVTQVRVLSSSRTGYAAEGVAAGLPVDLALVCTDAVREHTVVRLPTADGSVDLRVPGGQTAQPASLVVTGPDGALVSPTSYESGHRATWRRVRSLLGSDTTPPDLDDFAADHDQTRTAFAFDEG